MHSRHQNECQQIVVFTLDGQRCALFLPVVERVVRAVEITPLPQAPNLVLGIINAWGRVVPVLAIRQRLGLPPREPDLDDRFLLARANGRLVALVTDAVAGVQRLDQQQLADEQPGLGFAPLLQGVAKLPDGLILIYDLDRFLSLEEERRLDAALAGGG